MTPLIDTHTHLYLPEFDDRHEAVGRAFAANVAHLVFPNVDLGTIEPMRALAAAYPEKISMAMGLHPTEIRASWQDDIAQIADELKRHESDYAAIGEVGIDLYWDKTFAEEQMRAFDEQATWARERGLPIIIHCRDGLDQALEVMRGHKDALAIFHSFGGSHRDVEKIRAVGDFYFGINGVATFKNCHVRDTLAEITLDRLVLETDSPYLAPVPHRGKRNESAYLPLIATHIADSMGVATEQVASATTLNARRIFKLSQSA